MKKAEMSVAEFRATVTGYLDRAKAAIPHEVPEDTLDPCVIELTGELSALETFLHDFGYEERRQASEEERVTQRNTAKQRHATLEEAVMRIDRRVQAAVETLGIPRAEALLLPMQADLIIDGFVQLLDFFPIEAFTQDRIIPPDFCSARDTTVADIVKLMRDRKVPHE